MRRKRFLVLALLIFSCLWVVNYLLAVQCPNCFKEDDLGSKYSDQVNILENKVETLLKHNNVLLRDVKLHLNQVRSQTLVDKIRLLSDTDVRSKSLAGSETRSSVKVTDSKTNEKAILPVDTENKNRIFRPKINNITNQESISRLQSMPKTYLEDGRPIIAVLVFSCDRVTVRRSLDRLIRFRPSKEQFPIIVSQDCSHKQTTEAILSYGDQLFWVKHPDQSDIQVPPKEKKFKGYFKIARHYGWALNYTFFTQGFQTVIIVEDDLDVSEDFFEYFLGTFHLLRADPTLWCVSAWNDNGNENLVDSSQPQLLHRTDFFPGLGWMLTNSLWAELSTKWPRSYWDDWIRKPEQRKNRSCIRPEVSRTKTFGKIGVSNGLFFEKHLKYIKLNQEFVSFTQMNLSYLLKENYDPMFERQVYDSQAITYEDLKSHTSDTMGPVKISYKTKDEYKKYTKQLGLMDDFKSGVGRTAYRGVVTFWQKSRRVYVAPQPPWTGYNITWS